MDKVVERLSLFLEDKKISKSQLADSIEVGRPVISHIFSGRNNITDRVLARIFQTYPELNPPWLLSGNGEMYRKIVKEIVQPVANEPDFEEYENSSLQFSEEKIENENIEQEEEIPTNISTNLGILSQGESNIEEKSDITIENNKEKPIKRIHKIVFFYEDRTFEEYYPQ